MMSPEEQWNTTREEPVSKPPFRRLRGYAFDPSLSTQVDTALVNEVVFRVPWEDDGKKTLETWHRQGTDTEPGNDSEPGLYPGPVGEYLEVIDYDPASDCFYEPVNLNSPLVLAQDGLPPSEGSPQFHQQMVYAVAMTTIRNFERALGRFALWSSHRSKPQGPYAADFVRRLRIYPHALREANAYYSPNKKALLFGYFPSNSDNQSAQLPGGMVFTCLSHDIIAHETAHALLDGMHRRAVEPTHPDALAFHEAFADIVALFQHFSFPAVLRHEIGKTRGALASRQNALGQLAQQFGRAIGQHGALRDAIGAKNATTGKWERSKPDPEALGRVFEPHARGAILVAAVFDAFLAIYERRVADLYRIASSGTGVLPEGALHPDLVDRLAAEASKAAQHVLNMCVRALDYCPPVDITFGDYLRAIITADTDLVPDDDLSYRVAFIESFRLRGIYPRDVRTLSVDSLRWPLAFRGRPGHAESEAMGRVRNFASKLKTKLGQLRDFATTRESYYVRSRIVAANVHESPDLVEDLEYLSDNALVLSRPLDGLNRNGHGHLNTFEVHSVRPAQRVGPDGDALNHAVIVITQQRQLPPLTPGGDPFVFRGGCTLILNLDTLAVQYAIGKGIDDQERIDGQRKYWLEGPEQALRGTYLKGPVGAEGEEAFALLHRRQPEGVP
jgi:hypothetical protein